MSLTKLSLSFIALLMSMVSAQGTLKYDDVTYATVDDYCDAITTGGYLDNIYYCTLFTESIYYDYWEAFLTGAKLSQFYEY